MGSARVRTALMAVAASLAVAAPIAASGCGSSSVAALDPVAQAAQATAHAGGAHLALAAQLQADQLGQPVSVTGEGFFNYSRQEGRLSADVAGFPASAAATLGAGSLHFEELFKSSAIYVGSPLLAGKLPGGARWMKLDIGRVAQAAGLNLQQLVGGQANPAQFLQYLRATAGSVKPVGSEVVRGVPTTRYAATIDLRKVADVVPSSERAQLRTALEKLIQQTGTSQIPVDAWIDSHRLVRRIGMALSIASGGQHVRVRLTLELFDFGATPSVSAPPASETYDATGTALAGLGGGA